MFSFNGKIGEKLLFKQDGLLYTVKYSDPNTTPAFLLHTLSVGITLRINRDTNEITINQHTEGYVVLDPPTYTLCTELLLAASEAIRIDPDILK